MAWWQLIEDTSGYSGEYRCMSWDVCFDALRAEFMSLGGSGGELADVSIVAFQDHLDKSGMDFFYVADCSSGITSFSSVLKEASMENEARKWICNNMLKGDRAIMKKIIAESGTQES